MARAYWVLGGSMATAALAALLLWGRDAGELRGEPAVALGSPAIPARISVEQAGERLAGAGLISKEEELRIVRLGEESGWALFQTPGVPGPGARVVLAALCEGGRPSTSALAHASFDGGRSWGDRPGVAAGKEAWLFDLGAHAAGSALQVALRLSAPEGELWLNRGGQDLRASVGEPVGLEWLGALEFEQDGLPRAPGEPLYAGHDLEVRAQSWPPSPDTRVLVHFQVDGGTAREAPARLVATGAGEFGHNLQWVARLPISELPRGSRLSWRIEAQAGGAVKREEGGGAGFSAEISLEPPAVTWAAAGEYRWGPREAGFRDLPEPFSFALAQLDSGWGPVPAIELYVPGITDLPRSEEIAPGGFVRVEAFSPWRAGRPDGEWQGSPLVFVERVGNNWRFRWNLLRGHEGTAGAAGLVPLGAGAIAEGDYRFKFRVSTDGGRTWLWLGTEGFPWGGADRTLRFAGGPGWAAPALLGDPRIAPTAVGARGRQRLELLNDSAEPMRLTQLHLWGPPVFAVAVDGCPSLEGCTLVLAPGERRGVAVSFTPEEKGSGFEASFGARVEGHPGPDAAFGLVRARLSASAL